MSIDQEEPIRILVPREAALACDTESTVMFLSVFVRSATLGPQSLGKVQMAFADYGDDPRELWEIPEVRRFVARIDEALPYWFFLADLESDTLYVVACCVCRVSEVAAGLTSINQDDLRAFVERQFGGMNQLW